MSGCMEPYALVGDHQPRVLVLALARTSYVNSASRRDAAKEVARRATAVQRSVEHPNVNFESQRELRVLGLPYVVFML